MPDDIRTSKHDLIARVATLELLVSDLIDLLWRVDPKAMERLAADADHDLQIQHNRIPLPAGEHQRTRLFNVLQDRNRRLQHRRGRQGEAA
ncbi:hypothetical protein [Phenylobacterium sp.]|uniref:hypothetical protein n=1 Tax=Phenylobacterium sp. TaxID=1871053 RepID=UPI002DF0489E|nr:hypothetical protein [Phenylobacterium sp.]